MADLAALPAAPALPAPAMASAAEMAKRSDIKQAAQDFESSFLSVMMNQMMAGLPTDGPFDGGHGEQMFRSLLTDAMAKQVVKSGGIGVADSVAKEMLKLQGLS